MPAWRLAIAIATPPATPLDAAQRIVLRQRAALAAVGAVALTLLLGWTVPVAPPAGWTVGGLMGVLGLGTLAWHVARLTGMPAADPLAGALAAALIAVALLPGLGPFAATVPASLAFWIAWRRADQRVVALLVQCGAIATVSAGPVNQIGFTFAGVTMLGFAGFFVIYRFVGPANDNPSMERIVTNWRLLRRAGCASGMRESEFGNGE